ncbi:MAG: hypothetical protein LBI57_07155 [Helicobacteraceae bacterium]|nr:hypothetical protein [Helicobacteraceae bacterium]
MKQRDFDRRLSSSPPLKAAILWGDPSLTEIYADRYLKRLPGDLSVVKLYYDEFDLSAALTHLSSPGLFNEGNLLIARIEKKIDLKVVSSLLEAIRKNKASYMLLIYEAEDAKAKSAALEKGEKGGEFYAVVRFYPPKTPEAAKALIDAAAKKGLELSDAQARRLLSVNDDNLSFALTDLDKLAVYGETTSALIDFVGAGYSDGDCFRLISALIDKRPFYAELERLFLQTDNEMEILLELNRAFRQLFAFFCAMRLGKEIRDFLGYVLPKDIDEARRELASRFRRSRWVNVFEALSALELSFKQSDVREKRSLLYALLIRFQTNLL